MDLRLPLLSAALLLLSFHTLLSDALPVNVAKQYLPPQPGYIPVYIQDGENPPDVASIYEVLEPQSPTGDKMDSEAPEQDDRVGEGMVGGEEVGEIEGDSMRGLRHSEELLIQQLTDSPRDNEVRGIAEEIPKGRI